ncbi:MULTISPECIES: amidase [Actinomadura]|uniref:Amidase n=1 Tax=Actinomadura yumaensis TaxID=111807 RepID=A0ABW2CK12_9ACTN|nr:amidase family protein [Actinomadura sp. J1-007]MWK38719.1 amidase [Actinomadura sp. J1-007]
MEPYEYADLDAVALRGLIRGGEVTAAEVEDVARRALARADEALNALAGPPFAPGEMPHRAPDGPFAGVPFLIKDGGPFARGVPFTVGSRAVRGAVAREDHELMARFRAAGLAVLGRTAVPEMAFSFATESRRYGTTRNPWAPGRGAGGSSGGSAALVAAGAVPMAHANDGAGSIRVPASCCGVVGLKPGRGRVPCGPAVGEASFGQSAEFAVTRTVRDAAHLLDAVAAAPVGEKYEAPPPPRPYAEMIRTDPGRLRVAVSTAAAAPVDAQVAAVAVNAGKVLEWIGHEVAEDAPGVEPDDVVEAMMLSVFAAGAMLKAPERLDRSLLEAVSRRLLAETEAATALDVLAGVAAQHRATRPVGLFFTRYDLLVTPTLARPPAPHGALAYDDPGHTARSWLRRLFEYGPFTAPFNVSGNPAISLPLGQSREGLPIGVQLVAAHGREDLLLQVAAQLEEAVPWKDRKPSVLTGA